MPLFGPATSDPVAGFLAQWQARGNTGDATAMYDALFTPSVIGTYTVDTLPAPGAANLGKYAVVTDLYGDKTDKVLCSVSGTFYYWQPLRTQYDRSLAAITGDQTVQLLKQGTVFSLSGTIGVGITRTVTMATANAWPGAQAEFKFPGTILGVLNIAGTGLGSAVSLLGGGYRKFSCELISGALAWKQLV